MSAQQNFRLIRFVKFLLDLIYGLLIFACGLLVLVIAFSPLIVRGNIPLTPSVPVAIGIGEEPQFDVTVASSANQEIRAAFVDQAQGTLRLETSNWYLIFVGYLAKLLAALGLAYLFNLLRSVIQAIIAGKTFDQENVERIRRMGYVVLVVGFLIPTVDYFAAREILGRIAIVEPALSLPSPFQAEVILASLLVLILAQVWGYGLELERDRALTI